MPPATATRSHRAGRAPLSPEPPPLNPSPRRPVRHGRVVRPALPAANGGFNAHQVQQLFEAQQAVEQERLEAVRRESEARIALEAQLARDNAEAERLRLDALNNARIAAVSTKPSGQQGHRALETNDDIDVPYTIRLYETGIADQAALIHRFRSMPCIWNRSCSSIYRTHQQ